MGSIEAIGDELEILRLVQKAGKGSLKAQRALSSYGTSVGIAAIQSGGDGFAAFYDAAIFARMAAARGAPADRANLLSILAILSRNYSDAGDDDACAQVDGEALALVDAMANAGDEGSEDAATVIASVGLNASPKAMMWAKYFKGVWD